MTKIYTKTGDQGETGLIGGNRVPKNHVRIEACGAIDEANAVLGIILANLNDFSYREELQHIQRLLFEAGAILSNPTPLQRGTISEVDVLHLEHLIDELSANLPPQTTFILPGGTRLAAEIHLARTMVRTAERRVTTVSQHQDVPIEVSKYLNRLSDYLHVLARSVNQDYGVADIPWQARL